MNTRTNKFLGGEVWRFAATGVANTAIDWSVYFSLTRLLSLGGPGIVAAKAVAFLIATLFSFFANRFWTFGRTSEVMADELVKFYVTVGSSMVINTYSMYLLLPLFGGNDLPALVLSTALTAVWNFVFLKFWVYARAQTN